MYAFFLHFSFQKYSALQVPSMTPLPCPTTIPCPLTTPPTMVPPTKFVVKANDHAYNCFEQSPFGEYSSKRNGLTLFWNSYGLYSPCLTHSYMSSSRLCPVHARYHFRKENCVKKQLKI